MEGTSVALACLAGLACFIIVIATTDDTGEAVRQLPYCGPINKSSNNGRRELIIVSTLDGQLSALDAANEGSLEWTVNTGPGPMLSSSIHRLELTNNGHWVRMIPSLSGGLYKFNGDSIEAIPITADSLLRSSAFLFSDDLVMSGGKESRTYGVELESGQVLYECSMSGCSNSDKNVSVNGDLLLVQRSTQTVRAVEVKSGQERWNFSVGQHDLNLKSDMNANCHDNVNKDPVDSTPKFEFKVIVPEGLVCALSKTDSNLVAWKHKFGSPIVTAWRVQGGVLQSIDLFSGSQWQPQYNSDHVGPASPSLYIGMHNKQLYIQESVGMQRAIDAAFNTIHDDSSKYPRIPWAPIQVTSSGLITNTAESVELMPLEDAAATTALSVLYNSEYVNGNGYYLFSVENGTSQCTTNELENTFIEDIVDFEPTEEETPVEIIMGSLWHWWKEVLIISITTAALVNLIINRNLLQTPVIHKEIIVVEKQVPISHDGLLSRSSSEQTSNSQSSDYMSRYLTDFDQVHCLGKGGFGVVFEAKNKIDDCHYAIKRITLPMKQESRDRVLREVKALAKLEHTNIVRYFNAWLEFPPAGWQDEMLSNDAVSINMPGQSPSPTSENRPFSLTDASANIKLAIGNSPKNVLNTPYYNNFTDLVSNSLPGEPAQDFDESDSFIVFENSHQGLISSEGKKEEESVITVDSTTSGLNLRSSSNWELQKSVEKSKYSISKKRGHRRPGSLDFSQVNGSTFSPPSSKVYLFIQMQLCRKESLREWLVENTEQRPTDKVLQIFEQIVQAVEYVHLQGLIHRDLKPSNIFFSPDGQIKVGDFGLVTAMVEDNDVQRTPSRSSASFHSDRHTAQVGTQLYMSPEQLMGLPYNYKVDIYSLGLILFELLMPFSTQMERGRTLNDLRSNIFPQHFRQQFPHEFELLQQMLSHMPDQRPTTLGIRARPPLCSEDRVPVDESWHYELPQRKRVSSINSLSNGSSIDSMSDN